MASILRTGKFARYFAGFTRSIVFNSVRETEGNFVQSTQCICGNLTSNFSTSMSSKADQSLERSIKRLDSDVRRVGRISRRDIEEILEEIRSQKSATSSQSLLVIRCCGNLVPEELPEVRTSLVQEIWKTLNLLKVPMDISHYNALLRVYLENEHQFSPADFLADLELKGIEPNRVTYQRLVARYCQQGDIEGATRILEFMREKSLPVNENVFNALILGHSEANDMESAAGILGVMKQAGLEPSADTYTTLLCCYAKRGDTDAILKMIDDCEGKEIFLLDKDFLDVVYALTINGYGDKIEPILEKIRKGSGYNQDAVSSILRLTNKGHEDVAFKILKSMLRSTKSNGELNDTGTFFIRQLVKAQRPIEKIIKICSEMTDNKMHSKPLLIAAEIALEHSKMLIPLLKELKNNGFPIRQHYFWPLICSAESSKIFDLLKDMQNEFELVPNSETVRDYVIPNLKESNYDTIITMLRNVGVSTATASSAIAFNVLQKNNLKEAASIMQNYKAYYAPGLFRKSLVGALGKTKDFDSYIKIVRVIYDSINRLENMPIANQDEVNEDEVALDSEEKLDTTKTLQDKQANILGNIVIDAIVYFKTNRVEYLTKILNGFVEQGLTISNFHAEKVQERIAEEMTPEISDLLAKLSSGDLAPSEIVKNTRKGTRLDEMSVDQLERFIENVESKGEGNTGGLKRALLINSIKTKDLQKTEQIVTKLEMENYPIGIGIYSMLIDLYCQCGKLTEALEIYDKLCAKEPDFMLDNLKVVKLAELMVKQDKFDDAIEFIKKNKKEDPTSIEEPSFNYTTSCWKLLNYLAESGNLENVEKCFQTLLENNFIKPNNVLLGCLIKVNLVRDDVKKAIETFEIICNKYKTTPWKNELACRLIQIEDAINLQKLTDLSTNIHGEVNSLYDLVFSFVECGRIRQARKILETPGLRNRPQRLNSACERYHQEGMIQSLEGLVEATKDLSHIDRNNIFYNLLLSYCKQDQPDKALGLWTKMQEEDIAPNDQFLVKLAEYLKSKNLEIPFVVPLTATDTEMKTSSFTPKYQEPKENITSSHQKLRQALKIQDVDAALQAKKEISNTKLSLGDFSYLIELLCQSGRMNEANKCAEEMMEMKQFPIVRIFKFYLNKLANSGDILMLDKINKFLNDDTKKVVSFDNKYCHANIVAGKSEEYLNKLKANLDSAKTDEELAEVATKFPRGGALGILDTHPELLEKFNEVAISYANKNITGPMNVLWIYHFVNNNKEKSQEVYDKYLKSTPRLMFQRIIQLAREKSDENIINSLITNLKEGKVSEGALGNAYSCYLDILNTKTKYDEGLEFLKTKVLKDVCLEHINRTALIRLKNGIEASGKKFPYDISKKTTQNNDTTSSSSSSSSSSDEDIDKSKNTSNPVA